MKNQRYIVAAYCEDVDTLQAVLGACGQCTVYTLTPAEYREAKLDLVVPQAPTKPETNGVVAITNITHAAKPKRVKTTDAVLNLLQNGPPLTGKEVKAALPGHKTSTIDTTLWKLKSKGKIAHASDGTYVAVK